MNRGEQEDYSVHNETCNPVMKRDDQDAEPKSTTQKSAPYNGIPRRTILARPHYSAYNMAQSKHAACDWLSIPADVALSNTWRRIPRGCPGIAVDTATDVRWATSQSRSTLCSPWTGCIQPNRGRRILLILVRPHEGEA